MSTCSIDSHTVIKLLNESDLVQTKLDSSVNQLIFTELQDTQIKNKQFDLLFFNYEVDSEEIFYKYFEEGLHFYITNQIILHPDNVVEIVVNNLEEAMILISSEFYNHPEKKLKTINLVGDNSNKTALQLTETVLDISSSKETCCVQTYEEIELTEIYKRMSEAVNKGIRYFIVNNYLGSIPFVFNYLVVYSIDESGEKYGFENFEAFYKKQSSIMDNAEKIIIHRDVKRFEDIFRKARNSEQTKHILVFGSERNETVNHCDIMFNSRVESGKTILLVKSATKKGQMIHIDGNYTLNDTLRGNRNEVLITGTIILSKLCGINISKTKEHLEMYQI